MKFDTNLPIEVLNNCMFSRICNSCGQPQYSRWRPTANLNHCFVHEICIVYNEKGKKFTCNHNGVLARCELFKSAFVLRSTIFKMASGNYFNYFFSNTKMPNFANTFYNCYLTFEVSRSLLFVIHNII
jgi:hypothetical protein